MDNKFKIRDKIYYNSKVWYIIGIRARLGYDSCTWEYELARSAYGDYDPFTSRCDVTQGSGIWFKEHELSTLEDFVNSEQKRIVKEIEKLESLKEDLNKELEKLNANIKD